MLHPGYTPEEFVMDSTGSMPVVDEGQPVPGVCEAVGEGDDAAYHIGEDARWDSDAAAGGDLSAAPSTVGDGQPVKPNAVTMSKKHD